MVEPFLEFSFFGLTYHRIHTIDQPVIFLGVKYHRSCQQIKQEPVTCESNEHAFFELERVEPAFDNAHVQGYAMLRHFIDDVSVEQEVNVVHK